MEDERYPSIAYETRMEEKRLRDKRKMTLEENMRTTFLWCKFPKAQIMSLFSINNLIWTMFHDCKMVYNSQVDFSCHSSLASKSLFLRSCFTGSDRTSLVFHPDYIIFIGFFLSRTCNRSLITLFRILSQLIFPSTCLKLHFHRLQNIIFLEIQAQISLPQVRIGTYVFL